MTWLGVGSGKTVSWLESWLSEMAQGVGWCDQGTCRGPEMYPCFHINFVSDEIFLIVLLDQMNFC